MSIGLPTDWLDSDLRIEDADVDDDEEDKGENWVSTQATSTVALSQDPVPSSASSVVFSQQVKQEKAEEDDTFPPSSGSTSRVVADPPTPCPDYQMMSQTLEPSGASTHPDTCPCHELGMAYFSAK